ncbi:MAG: hypothetical protein Q7T55_14515 [Solirubrobacteraceae bacterium]|nr:hypothetical protein [Solirubrobacteraceae bacterium]
MPDRPKERPNGDRRPGASPGLPDDQRAAFRAEREARHAAREAKRREAQRLRRAAMLRRLPKIVVPLLIVGGAVFTGLHLSSGNGDPTSPTTVAQAEAGEPEFEDDGQTVANGPITAPDSAALLDLKLDGTTDAFSISFDKPPRSGLLFDLDDGRVLWRKDPTRVLPIASVTKMMTAMVVVNELKEGAKIKITNEALRYTGSGVGVLPKGKKVGLSAMLHGLLLASGNDAAIALAIAASGSQKAFIRDMNLRAQSMGLTCTHYTSPSGIVDKGNHSCAVDLAVQAKALLANPRLATIVGRKNATLPFPIKGGKLFLYNHNPLLREDFPGVIGVKTGYTDAAGKTFVAAVRHKGHRYGLVLLHSPDIGKQSKQLFERAYEADRGA